jgi:RNA polymerase sigma-70 factor (ECF subfamily)
MTDFEAFYEQYKNLVFNLSLHYVQNREDAEEITQDIFITVYEKLPEFRAEAKISTWLYRITVNRCIDFERTRKRKKRFAFISSIFGQDNNIMIDVPEFNHPGILMEQQEEMKQIFNALNRLPERQKTVIILLKIEEKSQAETAAIMGIGIKAVESLFQRAKNNLSKNLNNSEG